MKYGIICFLLLGFLNGGTAFGQGKQLTGQHAPTQTPALSPAEAQKRFVLHDGFEARLFAAEPDVINPVAMTWDDRGRLWVVELYEYPHGAAEGQKPRDRIKILEDTNNDGRADKITVFADGLNLATAILFGDGGVYVGQAPHLLFLKDTNGDDVADERTELLTGFGLQDRHELLNGFTWGPDGWLYMTHGVFTHSKVRIPEATDDGVVMDAAVARFNPRTKKFEIYADGTSNPWGVDFDRYGNAFVSACVIDHLYHMAPGGIYERQGGTPGNPYAYELLPSIVDHKHHMAAYCGINVYQGDNFPKEYSGRVFMGNIHQNAINHDRLIPNGSSFKAVAEKDFLTTDDGWFRPVVQNVGPDGALWIADWYDKYPCYQNAKADPEGVDREHGRIWRVVYTGKAGQASSPSKPIGSRPDKAMDLGKLKSTELVKVLEHPNAWQRKVAQRILMERRRQPDRAAYELFTALENLCENSKTLESHLAALSILNADRPSWEYTSPADVITDPPGVFKNTPDMQMSKSLQAAFESKDPNIRAWVARNKATELKWLLAEQRHDVWRKPAIEGFDHSLSQLERLASDPDPRVRIAVANSVRQLVSSSLTVNTDINTNAPVAKILSALIKSSSDAKDPLLPFMIWMANEPLLAANPAPTLKWLAENGADTMPLSGILARKAMRRICDTSDTQKINTAVQFLTAIAHQDALALATLEGLIEGQRAKPLPPTTDTKALFEKLSNSTNAQVKERAQQLGAIWGDAAAIQKTLATINNANAPVQDRTQAIEASKQFKNDAAREALLKLISQKNPEALVIAGLRSLSTLGGDSVGNTIVKNWQQFTPLTRNAAVEVLVTRFQWTEALLNGVQEGIIQTGEVSATARRGIAKYNDPNFAARSERLLGKFREADADKVHLIREKRKVVLQGKPDMSRGREIAASSCFVCHKLNGEGADVGPDLTGVGRSTLDALLAHVIDPNQIIGKGYENVFVETKDERSVSGRLVEDTDTHVKLLSAGPIENVVAKSDIESMRVSELSVMPEGLEQLSDEDFRDMIWFILAPPEEGPLTPEKRKALIGR
ncbi:MAG: c-type cytochrome [Verrucomicrobia bacterium]|nr:c-type cytochrome [Verrucomicrobiota bacterium]